MIKSQWDAFEAKIDGDDLILRIGSYKDITEIQFLLGGFRRDILCDKINYHSKRFMEEVEEKIIAASKEGMNYEYKVVPGGTGTLFGSPQYYKVLIFRDNEWKEVYWITYLDQVGTGSLMSELQAIDLMERLKAGKERCISPGLIFRGYSDG